MLRYYQKILKKYYLVTYMSHDYTDIDNIPSSKAELSCNKERNTEKIVLNI